MSIVPVISRELRSQARQPLTYWLRILGALSVAVAFAVASWNLRGNPQFSPFGPPRNPVTEFGVSLFGTLNLCILIAIWFFVPLATADAISRERREGTLALLYLTELRSWGIVIGKAAVHILRALSLLLTMAPWLMLPVIFGGVALWDVSLALMLNLVALILALAAGLLASTIPRDWMKAVILAEVFAVVLLVGMLSLHEHLIVRAVVAGNSAPRGWPLGSQPLSSDMVVDSLFPSSSGVLQRTVRRIQFTTNGSLELSRHWFGGPFATINLSNASRQIWFFGVVQMVAWSVLVLVGALWISAWCVRNVWRESPPSKRYEEIRRRFLSPRFRVASLRKNLSASLTANPIGWLQHYSPKARMIKWGWCLFLLFAEILLSSSPNDLYIAQSGLGLVLLLGLGFSSTGSFRNELETGAFELLLVTPLRESQIILGRLRGLWTQFFPAMAIYGAGSVYLASGWNSGDHARDAGLALARCLAAFCVLPVVGLYFSVLRLNFFVAWLLACGLTLLPAAIAQAFGVAPGVVICGQLILGAIAGLLLLQRLRNRGFLERAA